VELEPRVAAQEELVDLLLDLGAVAVRQFVLVEVAAGEQPVDEALAVVGGVAMHFLDGGLGQAAGAHHRRHDAVDDLVHVVAERDAAGLEVERPPEPIPLDAEQANLLVERKHLEDLRQVDACEIPA
jgi:hypothetical protein